MILILDAIEQKSLPGGQRLNHTACQKLAEAALELMYCSLAGRSIAWGESSVRNALNTDLNLDELVKKITGFVDDDSIFVGERRFVTALLCLYETAREVERTSGAKGTKAFEAIVERTLEASRVLYKATENSTIIGEMTYQMEFYLKTYCDYGVIPPSALAPALVQHLRDQYVVERGRLCEVKYFGDISLTILPRDLALVAFSESTNRPEMEGTEDWTRRTLEVFDSADEISRMARSAKRLSEVMKASMAAYLLYDVVRTSISWILKRYERNEITPPSDLYREKQVAEENRAWLMGMIEYSGERLLGTPLSHATTQLTLTRRSLTIEVMHDLLNSGMSLIPTYPDVLREAWDEILENTFVRLSDGAETSEISDSLERLEKGIRRRFTQVFDDSNFVMTALHLQDKWWRSIIERLS